MQTKKVIKMKVNMLISQNKNINTKLGAIY